MDVVIFALNAVLPVVALIALGYVLKRVGFLTKEFVSVGNKLCFRVFLPAMLFINVYKVKNLGSIDLYAALYVVCGIIGAALLGFILATVFIKDRRQKGVIVQCVFHANYAIIGVPIASMIFGAEGEMTASVLSAFAIPCFNVLAVIVLSAYDNEGMNFKETFKKTLIGIVTHPLIHGVLAGVLCLVIRQIFGVPAILNRAITDPTVTGQSMENPLYFLYTALDYLAHATTAFALIVLGAQFEFSTFKTSLKPVLVGTIGRAVLVPAIFLTLAALLGFGGATMAAFVAVFGAPVAVVSAIMAKEMNADGDLAATLVVSTTIVSAVTITVAVIILKALAII